MSNALWGALRTPCLGHRVSVDLPRVMFFRLARRDLRIAACKNPMGTNNVISFGSSPRPKSQSSLRSLLLQYPPSKYYLLRLNSTAAFPRSTETITESLPRDKPLSDREIRSIFGRSRVTTSLGNRTLGVLHARRLQGTLDLDLPADITRTVRQNQIDTALQWLRVHYPIDEDAAILARIEREDKDAEQKLIRRAEQLGLYKPQSGSYEAELGEETSVHGKSVLLEARRQNEARLLNEKERKRREWLEGEHEERERLQRQIQVNTSLQQYEEAALTEGM